MARRGQKERPVEDREETARRPAEGDEAGGFAEEERRGKEIKIPQRARHGRTIGDTATSYDSVGGAEEPEEWPERIPQPDDNAPDYETPGGVHPSEPEATSGPVRDVSFRPAPGGYIESEGRKGRDVPYTGEVVSTRGSTFEEDPDRGKTAAEEEGDFVKESLEERTWDYESG